MKRTYENRIANKGHVISNGEIYTEPTNSDPLF